MDYRLLVDKVELMSQQISLLQNYIEIKFGLDYKVYCNKRRRRREKEQDHNNTTKNDGIVTRQKQPTTTPLPAGDPDNIDETESSSVLTVATGRKDNSPIGNAEDDEVISTMSFETANIKVEKLDDEDVEPFCVDESGEHHLLDTVFGGSQICDDDDGDNSEIHNADDEFFVTISDEYLSSSDSSSKVNRKKKKSFAGSRSLNSIRRDSSSVEGQAKSDGSSSTKPVRFDPIEIGDPLRHSQYGITYKLSKRDKAKESLVLDNYVFTLNAFRSGTKYWLCSGRVKGCKARIVQQPDGKPTLTNNIHPHPPPPPEDPNKKRRKRKKVVKEPPSSIV